MPLLDHFHPPLSVRRHWHAFHNSWATYLASDLNRRLPENYFAEANVQFGIEIDVATFQEPGSFPPTTPEADGEWTPPEPVLTIPFPLVTDVVEILVYATKEGPILAGAVELVSPANKDRPESREAFVSKCETYLQQGVGLVMADVVTERTANLHLELLARLGQTAKMSIPLFAASYRPVKRQEQTKLDIWQEPVALNNPLPTMPLWLRGGLCLPVDLETTYERTCQEQRVKLSPLS